MKTVSLEEWIKKAQKDGIVKEDVNMEENKGSIPLKNEHEYFTDEDGYTWIKTSKGLNFPLGKRRNRRGKRGFQKCKLLYERFAQEYPIVAKWLNRIQSSSTKRAYATGLLKFCRETDTSPKEFADLWRTIESQTKAKVMVTQYVQTIMRDNPLMAEHVIKATKNFFRITSGGFKLPLDTGKGGALYISNALREAHEKRRYSFASNDEMREGLQTMLPIMSRDLKDLMAVTLLYRAGVRDSVLSKLRVKHTQDRFIINDVEILCLTITGELDGKIKYYNFPRLLDSPGQPRGYYTYLAGDSLELFDRFMERYHKNSTPNKLLFADYEDQFYVICLARRVKRNLEKAGYPEKEIWLHQLRSYFEILAHEVLKRNRAEMLGGHLLKGPQEHYQKRNKIECGKDYLKIQFISSAKFLKAKWLKELETKKLLEEEKLKRKIEQPQPVTPQVESQKETFVLGPTPKECLRGLNFKHERDNSLCKQCMQTRAQEYQACQELKEERSELFT